MIVISLLLILVAVTLLVLGLTGGSSNLLISSIVASLLAAVALVVGARQAARRPAGAHPPVDEAAEPGAPEFVAEPSPQFVAEQPVTVITTSDSFPAGGAPAAESASPVAGDGSREAGRGSSGARSEPALDDTGAGLGGTEPDLPRAADYDRASSAINAARSPNPDENAWRTERAAGSGVTGGPAGHAEGAALAEEFDEPDVDDPDDEPLPQAVLPADAVRVARMDAEVLVVDGRPRYHLAECPHLVGRLTEAIGVDEAVELGFSPCGLCRPVDRLVSAATSH